MTSSNPFVLVILADGFSPGLRTVLSSENIFVSEFDEAVLFLFFFNSIVAEFEDEFSALMSIS